MKAVTLQYSKTQIDKAGELLKDTKQIGDLSEESLEILSNWRAYHATPLDIFAKVLKSRVKKIDRSKNAIVAQRLKRIPSILLKLQTHKTMRLSTMQDIGGLRAIFETVKEVIELMELYRFSKTRHTLFAVDNYLEKPKNDGYRGIHLVYKIEKQPKLFIEIQIRSHLQHIWATAVEVFGTLQMSSLKSGLGDEKWLEFFSLLSSVFALKEKTEVLVAHKGMTQNKLIKSTKKMIQDLRVIEQLNVYTALYRIQPIEPSIGRTGHYVLLMLDSIEKKISFKPFPATQIESASNEYLELEKKYFEDENKNVVLVNIGDIKKLEASYPNYFMDTKELVYQLSLITMDKFI